MGGVPPDVGLPLAEADDLVLARPSRHLARAAMACARRACGRGGHVESFGWVQRLLLESAYTFSNFQRKVCGCAWDTESHVVINIASL
jgi:hypothetical protein